MHHRYTIGVVAPSLDDEYPGSVVQGIQAVAFQQGLKVIVIHGRPGEVAETRLASAYIDGWIAIEYITSIECLVESGKPIITIAVQDPSSACLAILADNRGGFQAAVDHLVEHGHRRIAFVGCLTLADVQQRYEGYQAALAAHDIPLDPGLLVFVNNDRISGGREAADILVGIRPEIAQSIVGLGIDLSQVATCPTLAAALDMLLRQQRQ